MRSRRLPIGLVVSAALVVLVALLAGLQYKWLGQVSDAERDRLRTSLNQNAEDFANEFDREITRVYQSLQMDGEPLLNHDWVAFAMRYDAWRERAKDAQIVKSIYFTSDDATRGGFFVYRPDLRSFERTTWPDALALVKTSLASSSHDALSPPNINTVGSGTMGQAGWKTTNDNGITRSVVSIRRDLFPSVPAIVISTPTFSRTGGLTLSNVGSIMTSMAMTNTSLIVELDRDYLRSTLLPALLTRYFPHAAEQYRFAVLETSDGGSEGSMVFTRGLAPNGRIDPQHADVSHTMFAVRPELMTQVILKSALAATGEARVDVERHTVTATSRPTAGTRTQTVLPPPPPPAPTLATGSAQSAANFSIFFNGRNDVFTTRAAPRGGWQLVVQHTAGSLDAAVGQIRRRNLWLSFGILAVLGAGVALLVINAERSRRLAVQQMDFVATVSHELRTPLTVIRSAAQNLSAGVVSDPAQAKQYGDLIESEGRRLTDMVEQVLEYAGLSGNRTLARAMPLDPGAVARAVVESSAALCDIERVELHLDVVEPLPPVLADEPALRRALQNLLANALKYGADGRWIGVVVRNGRGRSGADEVQLSVSDRGRGIDAADLPHIFEAFYRGRYAVDRQIHGNGLGLSLVKRIAEAHGGSVTVSSVPGEGATFTIHLPAAPAEPTPHVIGDVAAEEGR